MSVAVQVRKLDSTDAFYVVDLDGAAAASASSASPPRCWSTAPSCSPGPRPTPSPPSACRPAACPPGINAKPDGRDDAVAAFVEAVAPLVAEGRLHLFAGTGVTADELAPLGCEPLDDDLDGPRRRHRGSGLRLRRRRGRRAGGGRVGRPPRPWWIDAGGTWAGAGGFDADVDVLFLAGRAGIVDDEAAAARAGRRCSCRSRRCR